MSATVRVWAMALLAVVGALVIAWVLDKLISSVLLHHYGPAHRARGAVARALKGQPEIWAALIALAVVRPFDSMPSVPSRWVNGAMLVLAVLSVTLFLARLAGWLIREFTSKDSAAAPSGSIFVNLTRGVIWAVGLTVVLGALGVQIGPLIASLGVAGIAVSLGLQDTLANFFSGLQITMSRQIQPGQFIRLSTAEEGTVVDVTWRNTTLLLASNDHLIVPNSVIAKSLITNFTSGDEDHSIVASFVVKYGSDLAEVERIALGVARGIRDEYECIVDDFEPLCRFTAMTAAPGVSVIVIVRVRRYDEQWAVSSALNQRLHERLTAEGIALAPPAVVPAAG